VFERFPLLYIAILYVFSTKDKIVFFMQQFALLIISLCIAVIICAFSVMNGFEEQITRSILEKTSAITVTAKVNDFDNFLESAKIYNNGFSIEPIESEKISKMENVKNSYTIVTIGRLSYRVVVYEANDLEFPIVISKELMNKLNELGQEDIKLYDPGSYQAMAGGKLTKYKQYLKKELTVFDKKLEKYELSYVVLLSKEEYRKLIRGKKINKINIDLYDIEEVDSVAELLRKSYGKNVDVKTWKEVKPEIINAVRLQKKIFLLLYTIMFILLCAIIVATSIAFFKEKRKDWALMKLLNSIPYSVEKIFAYKNIITFILSTTIGVTVGYIFTIYSNEIINVLIYLSESSVKAEDMFGVNRISYQFRVSDFMITIAFSLVVFIINFIVLLAVFKKENVSTMIRGN
jgi:lipoprotein-releasing system permease protein